MTQSVFEAISGAIGESDNDIGGLIQTRLTIPVSVTTTLVATYTWNGTTTVTTYNTIEVEIGDWIALASDGQLFKVVSVVTDTSVEIENPQGYTIPSGATDSYKLTRVLPVESALDWSESGKVGIDGVVYYYASRTDVKLESISHVSGGVSVDGLKRAHDDQSTVVNLNRMKSALDLVRRAMFVDYAEGEDLNALGRNLGVNRLPFLASDDVFRGIVKALAYNPKGTIFGLELALDALIGEGNYEIVEDLIGFPCTVFIRLLGTAVVNDVSEGKAFLTGPEYQPPLSDTTLAIDLAIVNRGAMGSIRWKDENLLTDCRLIFPSAHSITEYDGDTPHAAWTVQGTGVTEGIHITQTGAEVEFTSPAPVDTSQYKRLLRLQSESYAYAGVLLTVPTGAPNDLAIVSGLILDDGTSAVEVGVQSLGSSTFKVGIVSGGAFITGGTVLSRDTYYEVVVRKNGASNWELYIDGVLTESVGYTSSIATSGIHAMLVGHFTTAATSNQMSIKQLAVWVTTLVNFWTARGTGSVATANPKRFTAGSSVFVAGDVGKAFEVKNSGVTNPQNGYNNGCYVVDSYVDGQNVELAGPVEENALLQAAYPLRIEVPASGRLFQFPDDLGKEIVISGSSLGNDGTYVIDKLLQVGTLIDLESFSTSLPEKTNVCEVVSASFVTESGVDWQVNPQFVTESPLDWELSDAGSVTGTAVTLRQALSLTSSECYRVLEVIYSTVLSAQVLANALVRNLVVQEVPDLLFAYYPFYVSDPLGFVKTYLDDITAAGVIPDFFVE